MLRHGGRAVDVVYRRTDADTVDTEVGRLLLPPLRAGTLGLVTPSAKTSSACARS